MTARPTDRSTPLLLQGQEYVFRAPIAELDFQERVHRLGLVDDGDGDPEPCVLVLARSADMEMNELSIALAERGVRMARIDVDRCLDVSLTVYPEAPLVELDRWMLRPLLVWRRHFELAALPIDPGTLYGAYVADQWRSVADWMTARTDWAQVNSLVAGRHPDRITQLTDAAAFGLRTPRTVVTTRPARHRPGGARCVVKTTGRHLVEPSSGVQHGLFPRPLDPRRGGGLPEPAPVIVQQYMPSDHELRVFVVGEELIAYRVDKLDPAQLWVDPEGVDVGRVDMPPGLGDTLLALARYWRIDVVAFDLLVADDAPVFLEANINCDWRWFEHRSGEPAVSRAVAAWVTSRFEELLGSVARPGAQSG
ncbi:MAG TPA: hypothetical protein VHF06_00855 [Pseudonocardiaceae bacterium]|nr:hypothetical protein [Pseudonocardiaceae bacterium]